MKIQLEQIKGDLRNRVDNAIEKLLLDNCKVIAFFIFNDIDHEYSWRSKGKYIAVRYVAPYHGFQQYADEKIYFEKAKKKKIEVVQDEGRAHTKSTVKKLQPFPAVYLYQKKVNWLPLSLLH